MKPVGFINYFFFLPWPQEDVVVVTFQVMCAGHIPLAGCGPAVTVAWDTIPVIRGTSMRSWEEAWGAPLVGAGSKFPFFGETGGILSLMYSNKAWK